MGASMSLTKGALPLAEDGSSKGKGTPLVLLAQSIGILDGTEVKVYVVTMFDGVHAQEALLDSNLLHLLKQMRLLRGSVFKVKDFGWESVRVNSNSVRFVVLRDIEIIDGGSPQLQSVPTVATEGNKTISKLDSGTNSSTSEAGAKGKNTNVATRNKAPKEPVATSAAKSKQACANNSNPDVGSSDIACDAAAGVINLSCGSALAIANGDVDVKPIFQILDCSLSSENRYKLRLTDGADVLTAMLTPPLSHLVKLGLIQNGTVVQLLEYVCLNIEGQKTIVVIKIDIIAEKCAVIGDPKADSEAIYNAPKSAQESTLPPTQASSPSRPGLALNYTHAYYGYNPPTYIATAQLFPEQYTGYSQYNTGIYLNSYWPSAYSPSPDGYCNNWHNSHFDAPENSASNTDAATFEMKKELHLEFDYLEQEINTLRDEMEKEMKPELDFLQQEMYCLRDKMYMGLQLELDFLRREIESLRDAMNQKQEKHRTKIDYLESEMTKSIGSKTAMNKKPRELEYQVHLLQKEF